MRTQWLAALLLIAPWACGLGAEPGEGEVANAIVAIVNNEPITKLEADVLVREFYRDAEKVTPEDYRATWEKAREALVEHRLLIQEARRRKVEVPPEEVNAEVQRLERAGVQAESRREELRERLMVSRLLSMLSSARAIGPQEVKDYYEKHRDDFVLGERRRVSLLAVYASATGGDKAAAKTQAGEVLASLKKGEDFAALARKHSRGPFAEKGGDQGWMEKGSLVRSIDDVVFRLKPGEVSDLIETDEGYIILKVTGVQPASRQSLAEARVAIERRLQIERRNERRKRLLDQLRKNASIIRLDFYRKAAAPPAETPEKGKGEPTK